MTTSSPRPKRSSNALSFLILAISIGGFLYAILGYMGLQEAQIPSNWQQVPGQVLERGVETVAQSKSDGSTMELYQPTIRYRYQVGDAFLIGDQLARHHPPRTLEGVAKTEIEDLPQGANVTVYFNPADPTEAVLRKSDTIGPMQAISAGLAIGITTLAIFIVSFWRKQRNAPADQTA